MHSVPGVLYEKSCPVDWPEGVKPKDIESKLVLGQGRKVSGGCY